MTEHLGEAVEAVALRVGVGSQAVVGLLVLVVLVLGVLGIRVVQARARSVPEPLPPAATLAAGPSASPAPAGGRGAAMASPTSSPVSPAESPAASPAAVLVHVVGQVRRPGVVRLALGARVQQAIAAAGGALPHAGLSQVNLARVVADGEQVVIPRPGEAVQPAAPSGGFLGSAGSGGSGASSAAGSVGGAGPASLVDLNTADLAVLDTLPGVGPVLAQRIVDWRAANGRFSSVDELGEVSGIGDAVLGRLRPLVRV